MFQFVPLASCPGTGEYWKEPGSVLFAPFLQVFLHIDTLFSRLNSPSSLPCAIVPLSSFPCVLVKMTLNHNTRWLLYYLGKLLSKSLELLPNISSSLDEYGFRHELSGATTVPGSPLKRHHHVLTRFRRALKVCHDDPACHWDWWKVIST